MNKLLLRQLKKVFGDSQNIPKEIEPFIALVGSTYDHADEDRHMVERSFDLSSKEMATLNQKLSKQSEVLEIMVSERTKELRNEKARLLAAINGLSFGFIIADMNDKIILKNPALSKILELKDIPTSVHDIAKAFESIAEGSIVAFDLISSCKECVEFKRIIEKKEVEYGKKFIRFFCAPIFTEDETGHDGYTETIGYVLLIEDITEAKILERSRDEFFSIASHELRTPLTAIQGNASMLLDFYAEKISDPDVKAMITDIFSAGTRLIKIVGDFLKISRLEQRRLVFEAEPLSLVEVANEVMNDLRILANNKGLELRLDSPTDGLPQAFADRDKVKEIFTNFIGNAINYSQEGSVDIAILRAGRFLKVLVKDTGVGISPHDQTLLFRKFQQAGDVLARNNSQSTGLGLYISKLLVEAMGGTTTLEESTPGKGSTFSFTVPIAP